VIAFKLNNYQRAQSYGDPSSPYELIYPGNLKILPGKFDICWPKQILIMELNKKEELIVLSKILETIRFCKIDDESSYLALSPITKDLYLRVRKELYEDLKQTEISFKEVFIENFPHKLEAVKFHINNIENWEKFTLEIKTEVFSILLDPYKIKKETLNMLLS